MGHQAHGALSLPAVGGLRRILRASLTALDDEIVRIQGLVFVTTRINW
jgi:hypothetical protein